MRRRLCAIMFTDIVGFTSLMATDEFKTLHLLNQSRKIQTTQIENHHGQVIKEMGDGLIAKFESVGEAVFAAIEIQRKAQHLSGKLRIGIHIGDVTMDNEDILGDGVNIASRIESIADPGGIYITKAVNSIVSSIAEIKTQFLGRVKLKNIPKTVSIYAVIGPPMPNPSLANINRLTKGYRLITSERILSLQKKALDHWARGRRAEYFLHADPELVYFDDHGGQEGYYGLEAVLSYVKDLNHEELPTHSYEMVSPQVQVFGDSCVLTFVYLAFSSEDEMQRKSRATVVYTKKDEEWKMAHVHWSSNCS